MLVGKALRAVMARWGISKYRLHQVSGLDKATIGKLLREELRSTSWDKVKQLADGFEQIDPMAKAAFMQALMLPDDVYPELEKYEEFVLISEQPKTIKHLLKRCEKLGYLNTELISQLKEELENAGVFKTITFEEWISQKMQEIRRKEDED